MTKKKHFEDLWPRSAAYASVEAKRAKWRKAAAKRRLRKTSGALNAS